MSIHTVRLILCGCLAAGVATGAQAAVQVVGGGLHSLVVQNGGGITGWGNNVDGQADIPEGVSNVLSLAGGYVHNAAVLPNRTVVTWGNDSYGQLSTQPSNLTGIASVGAGEFFTLARRTNGTVVAWGDNTRGQCNVPDNLKGVIAVDGGASHSVALLSNGTIRAWGLNSSGQCTIPAGVSNVVAVEAGASHTAALLRNGTVRAWGDNTFGQVSVPGDLAGVRAIAVGAYFSLALLTNGTVRAWGWDYYGQCAVPAGLSNVVAISAGNAHALALRRNGEVVAWGYDEQTQCQVPSNMPLQGYVAVGASAYNALEGKPLRVTVKRLEGSNGTVSVQYTLKAKTARAGQDFTMKSGTLTWTNGQTAAKTIKVPILADGRTEGKERFQFVLSKPAGCFVGNPALATITISSNTKSAGGLASDAGGATPVVWEERQVAGPGRLSFHWRLDGPASSAALLMVDGQVMRRMAPGEAVESLQLGEGAHVIRWVRVSEGASLLVSDVDWTSEVRP